MNVLPSTCLLTVHTAFGLPGSSDTAISDTWWGEHICFHHFPHTYTLLHKNADHTICLCRMSFYSNLCSKISTRKNNPHFKASKLTNNNYRLFMYCIKMMKKVAVCTCLPAHAETKLINGPCWNENKLLEISKACWLLCCALTSSPCLKTRRVDLGPLPHATYNCGVSSLAKSAICNNTGGDKRIKLFMIINDSWCF